jgi:single-strand DNA-binding protein
LPQGIRQGFDNGWRISRDRQRTQYYTVTAWRRLAEVSAEYLAKGRLIYIGGRLKGRTWTGRDGVARYELEIVASEIQFLSPKPAPMGAAA